MWYNIIEDGAFINYLIAMNLSIIGYYSWGDMITIKGARSDHDWEIGDIIVEKPFIFYEPSGLENFNFRSMKSDGLLGNAIFYENHIIAINLINKEFRIREARP